MAVDLAKILVDTGRCDAAQLRQAQAHAKQQGIGLEQALTSLDIVTEDQIAESLGKHFGIPGLSLGRLPKPTAAAVRLVPEQVAKKKGVVPLEKAGDTLILLMYDPTDIETLTTVRKATNMEVQPVVGSAATIRAAIGNFYASASTKLLDNVMPFIAKLISEEAARQYRALPVDRDGNLVTVAIAHPEPEKVKKAIEMATGLQVKPVKARWEDVEKAIGRVHAGGGSQPAAAPSAPAPAPAGATPAAGNPLPPAPAPAASAPPPGSTPSAGIPLAAAPAPANHAPAATESGAVPVAPAAPPLPETGPQSSEPAPAAGGSQSLEESGGINLPNLGEGGGPEGPRTGLSVDETDREKLENTVRKQWGEIDRKLAKLVPEKVARKYNAVVTGKVGKTLHVSMIDTSDAFAIETIEFVSNLKVEVAVAPKEAIEAGLEVLYVEDEDEMAAILEELDGLDLDDVEQREELEALGDMEAAEAAEAAPVVRLVTAVIDGALKSRASDIHYEVYEDNLRIRYRVDGILREVMKPPLQLRDPVISRLKIMGKMDISERRLPQDGRLRIRKKQKGGVKTIDFRVSTVPTIHGEKVVMRILDREQIKLDLVALGMEVEPLNWVREAIHRPYGMVLVVGPSGCGKTNTLYSALADLNRPEINIMTCEDPVEFSTVGLNQVQAREGIGLTFASALRSFLRQDPDTILVGEVRDFETAEIAVKAALTGHMVLSTLHTNDAPACLNRLVNMGVEPFLIGSSLQLVVAQRLVREICQGCKETDDGIRLEQLIQMGFEPEEAKTIKPMKGVGCGICEGTGYYGRTGIFEVLRITDEMREMILFNGSQLEIKELARRQGMRTLRQAGLTKVKEGLTTVEEVIRETIA